MSSDFLEQRRSSDEESETAIIRNRCVFCGSGFWAGLPVDGIQRGGGKGVNL